MHYSLFRFRLIRHYVEEDDAASVITSEEGKNEANDPIFNQFKYSLFMKIKLAYFILPRRLHFARLSYVIAVGGARGRILRHADDIKEFLQETHVSHSHCHSNNI